MLYAKSPRVLKYIIAQFIMESLSITNIAILIGAIVLLLIVIKLFHDIVSHWMNTRN
jgi:hypothetical protein